MKRFLSFILSLIMLLSLVPAAAFAETSDAPAQEQTEETTSAPEVTEASEAAEEPEPSAEPEPKSPIVVAKPTAAPETSESPAPSDEPAVLSAEEDGIAVQAELCKITFDAHDGSGRKEVMEVEKGVIITLPDCSFTRDGHKFIGWGARKSSTSPFIYPGDTYKAANRTFYAIWKELDRPVSVTVDYNHDGLPADERTCVVGKGYDYIYDNGEAVSSPLPDPTRFGYEFAGWYDAPEGGNEISADTALTGSITIYAHWEKGVIVRFDGNGYTGTIDAISAKPENIYGKLPIPDPSGYPENQTFDGWCTDAGLTDKVTPGHRSQRCGRNNALRQMESLPVYRPFQN